MTGPELDREALAAAVGAPVDEAVRDGSAELHAVPVAGIADTVVWRVEDPLIDHPFALYVGRWPAGYFRVLTDDQDAFLDLARASGATIEDAGTARSYVEDFLEITRGPSVLVRVVSSAAELPWRPGSEEEEERRAALLNDDPLQPPKVEQDGDGFRVELCLVVDQRVQRNTFEVGADGRIDARYEVLASDLPLPVALSS